MTDPVLVEVLRGDHVESRHRGAAIVLDAAGAVVLELGDVARPVFPRSAVKAIQALPLVESGAADTFGFDARDLAMACASHGGEPAHVKRSAAILARAGLDVSDLECGSHWPSHHASTIALAKSGATPNALHNNCSGKHAGFLCTCRHLGFACEGYARAGHPEQDLIRETMEAVTGAAHGADNRATDGCSIPTYAVPLASLARGFARMASGVGLPPVRAAAARRLIDACMAEPFYVAGSDRADTRLMEAGDGEVFVKIGAEGVYCAALPKSGVGIALKCEDGGERAAEAMIAAILARLPGLGDAARERIRTMSEKPILSRNGVAVGAVRAAGALAT